MVVSLGREHPLIGHPVATLAVISLLAYLAWTALLVALGLLTTHVLAHGTVGHWDDSVNRWFVRNRRSWWSRLSGDATFMANTAGIVVIAAVVTGILLLRRWGRRAWLVVIGLAIEFPIFLTTNYLVARPRPQVSHLGATPSTYSWPSGHAAATFVIYGSIAVIVMRSTRKLLPRLLGWLLAVGLTQAVAVSRIYNGEHHTTDAMAGVVLGLAAVWSATVALRAGDAANTADTTRPGRGAEPEQLEPRPVQPRDDATRESAAVQ